MNVALPIVSQLVQVWVDSRKDGSKTTEIPFINDHRRTFTLIFHLNATVSFDAIDAKYFRDDLFWMINTLRAGVNRVQIGGFSVPAITHGWDNSILWTRASNTIFV